MKQVLVMYSSFYFKQVVLLIFFQNSKCHHNFPSVQFWQVKIGGTLKRANTEPSMYFRKANTERSLQIRIANRQTYQKKNVNLSKKSLEGRGFPRASRAAAWNFPWALPSRNPSEQPCKPLENPAFPPLLFRLTQSLPQSTMWKKVVVCKMMYFMLLFK